MCWGKGFWFYCHSDHCYHYPAHSYYLWENGSQVVRMLAWNLKFWKNRSESWKSLGKSPWNLFLKKGMDPRVLAQSSLSVSLSPLSEWYWVQVSQQQNLMKCWRRGGGSLWWTNILSRRVGRSNSFSCFMLQKLGETLAAMWANAVCIVFPKFVTTEKVTLFQKVYFLFLISSTSEECKASTCSTTLEAHNKAVLHSLRKLITVFNKIDTYIGVLASASKSTVERFTIECYEIKTDWKIITIAH